MKNLSNAKKTVFAVKQSKLVTTFMIIIAVLSTVGLIINVYSAVEYYKNKMNGLIFIAVSVCCLVLLVYSVLSLFYSKYIIKNNILIKQIGFYREKTDINTVTEIKKYKTLNALVIYVNEDFYLISVNEYDYDGFIDALKSINKSIVYSIEN